MSSPHHSIKPPFSHEPRHKVLRYLDRRDIRLSRNQSVGSAIVIDVGTTGLSYQFDHVTELGWVEIAYDSWHQICGVYGPYVHRGIFPGTLNLVSDCGQSVGSTHPEVQTFLERVDQCGLIISHNNGFDRAMLEKAMPALGSTSAKWACTLRDLDWRSVGSLDNRLCDLLDHYGACHNRHDTEDDVIALAWLLGRCWPEAQTNPFPYPKLSIAGNKGPTHQQQVTNLSMLIRKAEEQSLAMSSFNTHSQSHRQTPSFGEMDF